MQAYFLKEKGVLVKEDLEVPKASKGEVVIKITRCGICRTDRKAYQMGQRDLIFPRVLGHEICGVVYEVGEGVDKYSKGMRVAVHPGVFCGKCSVCQKGKDQLCSEMQILGFHIDGGFQEYCLISKKGVDEGILFLLSSEITFKKAVLMEPLGCAINMMEALTVEKDDFLLIVGAGVLGILTAKLWQYKNCEEIVFIEKEETKQKIAQQMGFTVYKDEKEFLENHGQKLPTVAIPCCPQNDGFYFSLKLLEKGGRLGFFSGLTSQEDLNPKLINELHYKELRLYGSYGCGFKHTKKALELLKEKINLTNLPINEVFPENLEENLQDLEQKNALISTLVWEKEA